MLRRGVFGHSFWEGICSVRGFSVGNVDCRWSGFHRERVLRSMLRDISSWDRWSRWFGEGAEGGSLTMDLFNVVWVE